MTRSKPTEPPAHVRAPMGTCPFCRRSVELDPQTKAGHLEDPESCPRAPKEIREQAVRFMAEVTGLSLAQRQEKAARERQKDIETRAVSRARMKGRNRVWAKERQGQKQRSS